MILDQNNDSAMNCDLKDNLELKSIATQEDKSLLPAYDREHDNDLSCCGDEVEICRLTELPSAPIYGFDEDGDILAQDCTFTPCSSVGSEHDVATLATRPGDDVGVCGDGTGGNVLEVSGYNTLDASTFTGSGNSDSDIWLIDEVPGETGESRSDVLLHRDHNVSRGPQEDESAMAEQRKSHHEDNRVVVPKVEVVEPKTSTSVKTVPKIDLHASSIEIVEDYLEEDLSDAQLRDFCSMVVSNPGKHNPGTIQFVMVDY